MTVLLRDASHYDGPISYSGLAGLTSKATEGTTTRDATYGGHMDGGKGASLPILGGYHVVRTPGNGGNGTLAEQLSYWVAWMDGETPWWRGWPHWILQIDAEKWPYDAVSPATVKQFAAMVKGAGLPGWAVTYASKGQYGDSLAGIATPLWNANYGSNTGTYPGDNAAAWGAYSGQTPVLLQYASKGYDHDAYRGTLDQLKTLIGGDDDMALRDDPDGKYLYPRVQAIAHLDAPSDGPEKGATLELVAAVKRIDQNAAAAAKAATAPVSVTPTDAQMQAFTASVTAALGAKLDAVSAQLNQVMARLTAAGQGLDG